jgi:pilus assembly protein Flp/PilA
MSGRHAIDARSAVASCHTNARHARAGETQMKNMINNLRKLVREESGQDLIEYAMLVALIALGCVIAVTAAGDRVAEIFQGVADQIPA